MTIIDLFVWLYNWADKGDTKIYIPEEVGYGIVAGFFLLIALYAATKPIGSS